MRGVNIVLVVFAWVIESVAPEVMIDGSHIMFGLVFILGALYTISDQQGGRA